jgi:tetratricopeptide (TPR) repeat protein
MRYRCGFVLVVAILVASSGYVAFAQGLDRSDAEACDRFSDRITREDMAAAYLDLSRQQPNEVAVTSLNCAIHLNPMFASAYYELGYVQNALGNYQLAIDSYTTAIQLEYQPLSWPYGGRGLSNVELGRYMQAIRDYTRAIQLDPDWGVAWHGRGLAYFGLNDFDKAIENFDKAIEVGEEQEFAVYFGDRGLAYAGLGDYERAIDDYTISLAYNPENAGPYYNRGVAFYEQGKYELAVADYTRFLEIDPEYAPAYYSRALSLYWLGEYDKAIGDYSTAIEISPEDASAYVGRGNAYSMLDENELALVDYNTAILMGLDDEATERLAYFNRGTIYIRLKEYEKAEMDLMAARKIDPDHWDTYERLGYLYQVHAMFPQALEQYQRYLELVGEEADPEVLERIEELEDKLVPRHQTEVPTSTSVL